MLNIFNRKEKKKERVNDSIVVISKLFELAGVSKEVIDVANKKLEDLIKQL